MTYVLLMLAYFTLLSVILVPEHRSLLGILGSVVMILIMAGQRVTLARQAERYLARPRAVLNRAVGRRPPDVKSHR
ncbi:hypothetical protein ACFSC4_10370 [Deinococcus malanensis]|uniref:hypothetical protein n=1 Tax=Deinococcus malanensis TaxID=1706855 RepID=UPI00362A3DC5